MTTDDDRLMKPPPEEPDPDMIEIIASQSVNPTLSVPLVGLTESTE
jgi:hypothetical protein